jgi:hypothetical protein
MAEIYDSGEREWFHRLDTLNHGTRSLDGI